MVHATLGRRPLLNLSANNGLPGLEFVKAASSLLATAAGQPGLADKVILMVTNFTSPVGTNSHLWGMDTGGFFEQIAGSVISLSSGAILSGAIPGPGFSLYEGHQLANPNAKIVVDGATIAGPGSVGAVGTTTRYGANGAVPSDIDFGTQTLQACLIYDGTTAAPDIAAAVAYLKAKYATP